MAIPAKVAGRCASCGEPYSIGDKIEWAVRGPWHYECLFAQGLTFEQRSRESPKRDGESPKRNRARSAASTLFSSPSFWFVMVAWVAPLVVVLLISYGQQPASGQGVPAPPPATRSALLPRSVPSPRPAAICADGWISHAAHRQGTCSWHGGVRRWLP